MEKLSFPFHLGSIIGNIIGIFTIYQMIERINCSVEKVLFLHEKELNFHTKHTLQNTISQCNLFEERNERNKVNQMKNSKKSGKISWFKKIIKRK